MALPSFDEIRPYNDSEVHSILAELIKEDHFKQLVSFLFPDIPLEGMLDRLNGIESVRDFQLNIVYHYLERISKESTNGIFTGGLDHLDKNQSYLFISNHRDIVLDSAFLNYVLHRNEFDTCEIAIGDNLLIFPWITHLVRLNKSFIVHRNMQGRQMLEYSQRLSEYIRHTLNTKKQSVWIAQREGRSKDGNDRTQVSLLKMLNMSAKSDMAKCMANLRIVPVAISYEYDPCDYLKAREFRMKRQNADFKKSQSDDLESMRVGIFGYKGRVHYSFGNPVDQSVMEEISANASNKGEAFSLLAEEIDRQIHKNYKLWPGNKIANSKLNNESLSKYPVKEVAAFEQHLEKKIGLIENAGKEEIEYILGIYANPVKNRKAVQQLHS